MRQLIAALCLLVILNSVSCKEQNLVCYYDSAGYLREGFAKITTGDIDIALEFCTHLIYGYAGLRAGTNEVFSPHVDLDMFHYNEITMLKLRHPQVKVYLSVGGDRDIDEAHPLKYIELLESGREGQVNFTESAISLLKRNGFDGLDLAFQLPRNKPRKVHGTIGMYWKKFKKLFTGNFIVDEKSEEHRGQFTDLASNLKNAFIRNNLLLSLTVLPNVNSTWYYDVARLKDSFDIINLLAFDFLTPDRNPEEADYTAPIYPLEEQNRLPHYNIDYQVNFWLKHHCPPEKLNLGIATYGRAWKLTSDSGLTGMPVVPETAGPAEAGLQSQTPGLLSWTEICPKLSNDANANYRGPNAPLRKVSDIEEKYGCYALRPADENNEHGIWVSFDDPVYAGIKTNYAKQKGLGGIAVYDLTYDDFRGLCGGLRYPILRSIRFFQQS